MEQTVIRPGDTPVTLINVFRVDPAQQADLVALLTEVTEDVMQHQPGFVSANLHVSLDGTRVVNYAQWRSREDFAAMLRDPVAGAHMSAVAAIADADPRLYAVSSVHHVDDAGDGRPDPGRDTDGVPEEPKAAAP
jgi:quinol monooxygenase YgiN